MTAMDQELERAEIRRVYRSRGMKGNKGYDSYKVTLPIEWTREYKIKEGTYVRMIPKGNGCLWIYKLE